MPRTQVKSTMKRYASVIQCNKDVKDRKKKKYTHFLFIFIFFLNSYFYCKQLFNNAG